MISRICFGCSARGHISSGQVAQAADGHGRSERGQGTSEQQSVSARSVDRADACARGRHPEPEPARRGGLPRRARARPAPSWKILVPRAPDSQLPDCWPSRRRRAVARTPRSSTLGWPRAHTVIVASFFNAAYGGPDGLAWCSQKDSSLPVYAGALRLRPSHLCRLQTAVCLPAVRGQPRLPRKLGTRAPALLICTARSTVGLFIAPRALDKALLCLRSLLSVAVGQTREEGHRKVGLHLLGFKSEPSASRALRPAEERPDADHARQVRRR